MRNNHLEKHCYKDLSMSQDELNLGSGGAKCIQLNGLGQLGKNACQDEPSNDITGMQVIVKIG